MKLFISADIEGTCGICSWDETEYGRNGYEYYRRQMSKEVSAACVGARIAGADEIVIKDAHDSARNILPDLLPENVRLFRGWARHPYCMMFGLDSSFDGVFMTGYHSAAGMDTNPLAHTMCLKDNYVKLNGELCPEALINSLTAAYLGVPVLLLTGDKGLCDWMNKANPETETVSVNEGTGAGTMSLHPADAERKIRAAAERAMKKDREKCIFALPKHFSMEIDYVKHADAYRNSFYPGARLVNEKAISFEADDWMDVLRFIHFVL